MVIRNIKERFFVTSQFLQKVINKDCNILDIGSENEMSLYLKKEGFNITNTSHEIDFDYFEGSFFKNSNYEVVTAFEVLEHLFSPLLLLENLPANKLVLTVPLRMWFAKSYMHIPIKDGGHVAYGHYHEFEEEQLHMLLDKAGWKILYSEKWKSAPKIPLGFRLMLRYFFNRYYAVYCEKVAPYTTENYKINKPV